MIKRTLWNLLKYLLALGLLGYVVYANWNPPSGQGLADVWQAHVIERQPIDTAALGMAFTLYVFGLLVTLYRWHILVRAQDLPTTPLRTLRIGLLGYFFNTFLPGSVGGDLVKAAAVVRGQTRRTAAVATVLMDRVIGLWSLVAFVALMGGLCWLAGMLDGSTNQAAQVIIESAASVVGVSLVCWVAMGLAVQNRADAIAEKLRRVPKIGGLIAELWRVLCLYRARQASVALAVGLSWISNFCFVLAFYCGSRAFLQAMPANPLPTLAQHLLILPLGSMLGAIPLFPGGAGISEAGFGGLYALFGASASSGILAALVNRFVSWVVGILGYLICHWLPAEKPQASPRMVQSLNFEPIGAVAQAALDETGR